MSGNRIQSTETHWKQWVSLYNEGSVETKWQQNKQCKFTPAGRDELDGVGKKLMLTVAELVFNRNLRLGGKRTVLMH